MREGVFRGGAGLPGKMQARGETLVEGGRGADIIGGDKFGGSQHVAAKLAVVAISNRASLRSSRVGVIFKLSCQILPRNASTKAVPAARTIQLEIDSVITLFLVSSKRKKAPDGESTTPPWR